MKINSSQPLFEAVKGTVPTGVTYYPDFVRAIGFDVGKLRRSLQEIRPREDRRTPGVVSWVFADNRRPQVIHDLWEFINRQELLKSPANYANVIHYSPGAGLGFHRDREMIRTQALTLTLGRGPRVLRLRSLENDCQAKVYLEPGSAYALEGDAMTKWEHGILADWNSLHMESPDFTPKMVSEDVFGHSKINPVETVSITIRALK